MSEYMFAWCKNCYALQGCYYQHGKLSSTPKFLSPECAIGGMEKQENFPLIKEQPNG